MDPDNFLNELKKIDSNIEIHNSLKELSKEYVQSSIDRRTREIDADCLNDDLERLRTFNLLSFLFFAIDNKDDAISYNDKALEIDSRSINALACRAYYYFNWGDFYESEKQYNFLKSTELKRKAILIAKAEVAYAYTKIGFKHFKKATEKFEEVFSDCSDVPERFVCSWKFSWALALRRQSHIGNVPCKSNLDDRETYIQKAEKLYKDIITMEGEGIQRYKARAYVDLGLEIIYLRRDKQSAGGRYENTDSYNCIQKSLSLEIEDDFVLSRSGKYFRLIRNPEKSEELLRKAVAIKETSFSCHHLALALRDLKRNAHPIEIKTRGFQTNSPREDHFRKLIKSPRQLRYFPPKETGEIIQYLEKAFALNNNISALYDKGLVLRSSRQYTEAVDVFKAIVHNDSSSNLQLACAYEQAALCLLEEAENDPTKMAKNEYNAKIFLNKSIELSYEMISKIPDLEESWESHQALRSLLSRKERTRENMQELATLYSKKKGWYPLFKVQFELIQKGDNNEEKLQALFTLFNASLSLGLYDDAVMAIYGILANGRERIDTALCVRTLIKGGIAAWQKDEKTLAKKRLKDALNIEELGQPIGEEVTEGKIPYDIFVLSSEKSEEVARPVTKLLQTFGPSVTLNSDDAMPGQFETEIMTEAINRSKYVVVFLAAEDEVKDVKRLQVMFTDKSGKTTIAISESNRAAQDPIYCRLPSVLYQSEMFSDTDNITEEQVLWVENFLFTLTEG